MNKKKVSVSEFKAKSLGLFEEVARTHRSIIVTKRGTPIAEVVPIQEATEKPVPDRLKGTILFEGDIVSPFGPELWQAAQPGVTAEVNDSEDESEK